jgi:5-amino-6-(5-phosphoribosylamino)uracil reductase
MGRPYVLLSCAMSLDGRIDHTGPSRLVLSGAADLDRVDAERAGCDAILVGAGTLRRDDPRLLLRSPERRAERVARGLPESPTRVTIAGGDLDPSLRFFTTGGGERLVYCPDGAAGRLRERLPAAATVVAAGAPLSLNAVLDDLGGRGVRRLMVEGGSTVNTAFLAGDLVDELQLAVAPLLVGAAGAPRFVGDAAFPGGAGRRLTLAEVRMVGDVAVLRCLVSQRAHDVRWLGEAVALSRRCPPSEGAYSVGAVIVGASGEVLATGWSRETDAKVHAEEAALSRVAADDPRLPGATIYSSLEPCSRRLSRPLSCSALIRRAGIGRVVFGLREPVLFVDGRGAEELAEAGVTVIELPELAGEVRAANAHLLGSG